MKMLVDLRAFAGDGLPTTQGATVRSRCARRDVASAEASGARGTRTFFIGNRRHVGPYDAEMLARELRRSAA